MSQPRSTVIRSVLAALVFSICAILSVKSAQADQAVTLKDFDPENFPGQPQIDNKWLPLVPGTQFVLRGVANHRPHRQIATITDLVKVIDNVVTTVIFEEDISDGELVEAEIAFHAQDRDGVVWNLGEYPEQYKNGKLVGADAWLTGRENARAGILMQPKPEVGTNSYSQGKAPKIDFADRAKVVDRGERTCVPAGCFDHVLIIREWNPLEQPQDGYQLKYHAPGTGVVRVEPVGGDEQEILVLVEIKHLNGRELARIRDRALELDRRAYDIASHVYRNTPPAHRWAPPPL